jgi:hypothetical protein
MQFFETLEARRLLCGGSTHASLAALADVSVPTSWMINFQPTGITAPAGYVADTGAVFGDRGNGHTFGWNLANSGSTRNRTNAGAPDLRYATMTHTQQYGNRTWEIAVPNGAYNVRVVGGDASFFGSTIRYNVEGTLVVNGKQTSTNKFVEGAAAVTVSDGRLTLTNADGAEKNKLCFIEINSTDNPLPPTATLSIAATDPNAAEAGPNTGTFKVTRTGSTAGSVLVGYTISGSASNGNDYNTLSGAVTISAGATSANITVTPKDDQTAESNENVTLTLKPTAGYTVADAGATVTIADNDSAPTNGWKTAASAPLARFEVNNAAVNGKLYLFGGYDRYINAHDESYVYDPAANTWKAIAESPELLTHSGTAVDGNNVYLAGGFVGKSNAAATNHVWKYDTVANTWARIKDLPAIRAAGGMVLIDRTLHFFGGSNAGQDVDYGTHWTLDLDDPDADWLDAPTMPDPRNHFGYIALNGAIYAIGGQYLEDERHGNRATVSVFKDGAWSSAAALPLARSHTHTSTFIVDGLICVAGGQANGTYTPTTIANVTAYDPDQNKWFELPAMPGTRQAAVAKVIDSKIIVTTGATATTVTQTTTWTYDISALSI